MDDVVREWLRDFLVRNEQIIIDAGADWVIRQALDLRGRRPREETRRLCVKVFEFNRALLLGEPGGEQTRTDFIEYVTTYRASQHFSVSTPLRGFLSFKKGLVHALTQEPMPAETTLVVLEKVDEIYFDAIFRMSDMYVDKLKSIIEERQEQLRQRDLEVERLERKLTESLLKRFLAPSVVDEIVSGRRSIDQKPRTMHVTVLFADLVGFTQLAQSVGSDVLADFLNQYLAKMSEQVFFHQGTIDKFMGDTIMALFGAPVPMQPRDQILLGVRCAVNLQRALLELDDPVSGEKPLSMRIGIDSGQVVVGSFGSAHRADFTAMGTHVNLARQLQVLCKPGEIYVTGAVARYLPQATEPCGTLQLKGVDQRVACFRVVQSRVAL